MIARTFIVKTLLLLNRLRKAIKEKHRGKLSDGVILLPDNATPHKARQTCELLHRFKWEVWQHPPYSPDLAPCDFHVFGKLKKDIGGQLFRNDEEVKAAVSVWLHSAGGDFYASGIEKFVARSEKCLKSLESYVKM